MFAHIYPYLPAAALTILLLYACYTDIRYRRVEDIVNATILIIGLIVSTDKVASIIGAVAGFISLFIAAIFLGFQLGGGDMKLIIALGAWFGVPVLEVFLLSFIICVFMVIKLVEKYGKEEIREYKFPYVIPITIAALIIYFTKYSVLNNLVPFICFPV